MSLAAETDVPVHLHHLRTHTLHALQPGPALLVLGAVHGNEGAGMQAIGRVMAAFDSGSLRLLRGRLTLVPVTNPLAREQGTRAGQRNLNRNLRPSAVPQDFDCRLHLWIRGATADVRPNRHRSACLYRR